MQTEACAGRAPTHNMPHNARSLRIQSNPIQSHPIPSLPDPRAMISALSLWDRPLAARPLLSPSPAITWSPGSCAHGCREAGMEGSVLRLSRCEGGVDAAIGGSWEMGQRGLMSEEKHIGPRGGEGREGSVVLHRLIVMCEKAIKVSKWVSEAAAHARAVWRRARSAAAGVG